MAQVEYFLYLKNISYFIVLLVSVFLFNFSIFNIIISLFMLYNISLFLVLYCAILNKNGKPFNINKENIFCYYS